MIRGEAEICRVVPGDVGGTFAVGHMPCRHGLLNIPLTVS
jgi:hypothetical protein